MYDATDPTPGGGDTGSVLISPYITPGTTTDVYYNHYSWLRTMEDLFDVCSCYQTATDITLPAGTVCGGLDGLGHLGYAAQVGLTDFGADVFSAPTGNGCSPLSPPTPSPRRRWLSACRPAGSCRWEASSSSAGAEEGCRPFMNDLFAPPTSAVDDRAVEARSSRPSGPPALPCAHC